MTPEGLTSAPGGRALAARTWADASFHLRLSLAFQLLMQLATFALLGPLLTWALRRLVVLGGDSLVSNYDIAAFVRSPAGVAFVVLAAVLTGAALLAEFAGQCWIAGHAIAREPLDLRSVVVLVARRWPALMLLAARVLARLVVLALPCLLGAFLVWSTWLRAHDINFYLALKPPEWRRALAALAVLGTAYAAIALWQLGRWIFAVPILVFEQAGSERAVKESARRTQGHLGHILVPLITWWVLLLATGSLVVAIVRPLEAAALGWGGVEFSRVLPLIAAFSVLGLVGAFLQHAVWIVGHQFLVTRLYVEALGVPGWRPRDAAVLSREDSRRLKVPAALLACVLVVFGFGGAWYWASQPLPKGTVVVTAHRGDSGRAPENTLAAFRAAIEAHADYAELDVQRTRDGQVVVLHDRDLMRMAGDPRRIGELTLADLSGIDVGIRRGAAFKGEHVPSLESVIDLVRGHMKLNVELKYNAPDPLLASATIEVLRRAQFLDQVVITSLDAAALKEVKAIEPRLKTGLIVTAVVGDVTRADADFLSLNESRATLGILRRAHEELKDVCVWTVNQPEAMLLMTERGADNLITDHPATAVRVLEQLRNLTPPERLALRLRVLFGSPPPELLDPDSVTPL